MMTSGKFYVDPENLSPQVRRGQEVIWSENNPNRKFLCRTDSSKSYVYPCKDQRNWILKNNLKQLTQNKQLKNENI